MSICLAADPTRSPWGDGSDRRHTRTGLPVSPVRGPLLAAWQGFALPGEREPSWPPLSCPQSTRPGVWNEAAVFAREAPALVARYEHHAAPIALEARLLAVEATGDARRPDTWSSM